MNTALERLWNCYVCIQLKHYSHYVNPYIHIEVHVVIYVHVMYMIDIEHTYIYIYIYIYTWHRGESHVQSNYK